MKDKKCKFVYIRKKDHPKLYLWAKNWEKLNVPKPDTEPVPVMEVMKTPIDSTDTSSETSRRTDIKIETKASVKDDHDDKSIASDSELMKILEEDSSNSDESKVMCKKEDSINSNGGHILLDALTRNGSPDEKQKLNLENAIENISKLKRVFFFSFFLFFFFPFFSLIAVIYSIALFTIVLLLR